MTRHHSTCIRLDCPSLDPTSQMATKRGVMAHHRRRYPILVQDCWSLQPASRHWKPLSHQLFSNRNRMISEPRFFQTCCVLAQRSSGLTRTRRITPSLSLPFRREGGLSGRVAAANSAKPRSTKSTVKTRAKTAVTAVPSTHPSVKFGKPQIPVEL